MISTDPNRIPFNASKMACSTVRSEDEFSMSCRAVDMEFISFSFRRLANHYIVDHNCDASYI